MEEQKDVKVHKLHKESIDGETSRYEFGRLVNGGMIGSTYIARFLCSNGFFRFYCVKRINIVCLRTSMKRKE